MEIFGAKDLLESLREHMHLTPAAERYILEGAAAPIKRAAQENLRKHKRTGRLHDKIAISRVTRSKKGATIRVGVPKHEGVAYGIPLEWGHANKDGGITPPYPFMQPAYDGYKEEAQRVMAQRTGEIIERGGGGA